MQVLRGIPVSVGVAIAPALLLDTDWYRIPQRFVNLVQIEGEILRLRVALQRATQELRHSQRSVGEQLGRNYGAIFEAHALLLEDPALVNEVETLVRNQAFAAEYALTRVVRKYVKAFEKLGGGLSLASRSADLYDVERRILAHLLGERKEQLRDLVEPVAILAHDLTPSEAASLDPKMIHGFATEVGGRTSHTAIVAGALEIPAVVGLGPFVTDVTGGDLVIIDGHRGLVILDPDAETLRQYETDRRSYRVRESQLGELRDLPSVTKDGTSVTLLGNVELPQEAKNCVERGAAGVGLYRTEFLYLGQAVEPTEDEQVAAYSKVTQAFPTGQPVVIRTMDLGADKFNPSSAPPPEERNPFLGVRSVRLCLLNLPMFKRQMRAILRTSVLGNVHILFPMISTLHELRQCKMLLSEVKEDLEEAGIAFNPAIPIGTMIEVPAAAMMVDALAREVDFLSIGTNDLVQYTLAADRGNEHVASLYNAGDPAVLRLIQRVLDAGAERGIRVNVCGEMSGDPLYTLLLLGMGLRHFSLTPHNIPEIKRIIRAASLDDARRVADEAMRLENARDVMNYLREQTRRVAPDGVRERPT